MKCPKCNGVGAPWNNSASIPCDLCGGAGIVEGLTPEQWSRKMLIDACDRLLETKKEVMEMDKQSRTWFMGKPGHRDCFIVASALKAILEDPRTQEPHE